MKRFILDKDISFVSYNTFFFI